MLSESKLQQLRDRVYKMLAEVGFLIESEALTQIMLKKGCTISPFGRTRIPKEIIDEMVQFQKTGQISDAQDQELLYLCGPDWAHHIIWHKQQNRIRSELKRRLLMSAFDCGPTRYYHYEQQKLLPVDTDVFIKAKKFAQATPEIGYISTWYRQDVPPKMERLESLVLGLKYTDKLDGVEAIYPQVIKYLVEASQIITGKTGDSSYLAGSECITSPLIMGTRSAEDILERERIGVARYHVATMPTIGVSTPVTMSSAVVLMAAEILGGMTICWCVDPESDISGRAICSILDMRTALPHCTGPETTVANLTTKALFDAFWGGQCWVEIFLSPHAIRPGLTAVCENLLGGLRAGKMLNIPAMPYPGMGTLGDGGIGSFEQFILDREIRNAQHSMKSDFDLDDFPFDEYCRAIENKTEFLSHEHTLNHFKELWSSDVLIPMEGSQDEKNILDKAHQKVQEAINSWQPTDFPQERMKALEKMLRKAGKELTD
ncbi:MAG: trimethylamine methyltransferase family protein [Planctomycetota bacterium]